MQACSDGEFNSTGLTERWCIRNREWLRTSTELVPIPDWSTDKLKGKLYHYGYLCKSILMKLPALDSCASFKRCLSVCDLKMADRHRTVTKFILGGTLRPSFHWM